MTHGIDSREAWVIALVSLLILTISFGAPFIVIVALKSIAAELGRSSPVQSANTRRFPLSHHELR